MANTKSAKIEAEIEKVKAKIAEQQTKLKELEQRKVEAENSEIVDIVRGMSIPLAELPLVLQQLRAGKTLGQNVQSPRRCLNEKAACPFADALRGRVHVRLYRDGPCRGR